MTFMTKKMSSKVKKTTKSKSKTRPKSASKSSSKKEGKKRTIAGGIYFSDRALDGEPEIADHSELSCFDRKTTYLKQLLNKNANLIQKAKPPTAVTGEGAVEFSYYTIDEALLADAGYTKKYYAKHYDFPDMVLLASVIKNVGSIPNKNYVKLMSYLSRKQTYIIGIWDIFIKPKGMEIVMIQELASNRDLGLFVRKAEAPTVEWMAASWLRQIFKAMDFLGDLGVCHRNINPKYILLQGQKLQIKLSHFYDAFQYWDDKKESVVYCKPKGKKEKEDYQAPEVHGKKEFDPIAADIWSLGAVLYHTLTQSYPKDTSLDHLSVSTEAKTLISACLHSDPETRIAFETINTSQWFNYEKSTARGYGFP